MGAGPSRPSAPPLPDPPPPPPPPKVLLEDGDELIPQPMLAKERKKLLSQLASAIDNLFDIQNDMSDKIEKNTDDVKAKIAEIKRLALKAYRKKSTDLQVIYSDIQESGDDDCETIQEEIAIINKQINHIKAKNINTDKPTEQEVKLLSELADLEYNLERLKESLNSRKHKTSLLLIAAEAKGEDELTEIKDQEKYDIKRVKKKQEAYVESVVEELTDEISKTIKNFAKMGVFIPPIILNKFNTMVIPTLLIKNGIRSR
jgi:hypothetical protein